MASIPWLADVLRTAGVPVVEEGDWRNRSRSGSFDPIGVLWHHTASTSSASNPHPTLNLVIVGRGGDDPLPGPLCHALVDYHGVFHLISGGRANHAGESGGSGPIPAGDGNAMLIGWEIDYNGETQGPTAAQYTNSVIATAAVLRHLGRDASFARGHRETSTTGKIDPSFVNLDTMRADVSRRLVGPSVVDGLDATTWGSGRLDLFARSDNRRLVHRWFTGGRWSGWEDLGGTLTSDPAAVAMAPGRLDVFARGGEGQLVHKWYADGGWSGWEHLGGVLTSAPDVVSWGGGRLDVFVRGPNDRLFHRWFTGGRWSGWEDLGGGLTSAPTAASWGDKRIDVFARGGQNQLVHKFFAGDRWSGWEHLAGSLTSAPVAATAKANRVDVFARGTNDRVLHRFYANSAWSGWEDLGGPIASPPTATSWSPTRFDVFAVDRGNRLLHSWYADNRWSPWESLGAMP